MDRVLQGAPRAHPHRSGGPPVRRRRGAVAARRGRTEPGEGPVLGHPPRAAGHVAGGEGAAGRPGRRRRLPDHPRRAERAPVRPQGAPGVVDAGGSGPSRGGARPGRRGRPGPAPGPHRPHPRRPGGQHGRRDGGREESDVTVAQRRMTRRAKRDLRAALVFIAPAALGFVVFFLVPTVRGMWFSLTDANLIGGGELIGVENYRRMFADELFWNSVVVTIQYVVINISVQTVLAVLIAVLLHRLTQSVVIRGIVLLPYLVANVVVALVWFWMFDYSTGIVNVVLDGLGVDRVAFFGDEATAIPTIALINVWRFVGYTALLVFAGLQTIPKQLYEAAALDGAGEARMFRSITLPLLRPVLALVLVITVVGSFQIFDTVAVTTQGGPVHATRVIYYYIYQQAFERFDLGYASALSVALLLALALIAYAQLKLLRSNRSDLA